MSLTVGGLYKMFPAIQAEDIEDILGTENFDKKTTVKPGDVAQYTGRFSEPLSIFFAKKETNTFLPLLDDKRRQTVTASAGIKEPDADKYENGGQKPVPGYIPMDTSVFDIAKQNEIA